MTFPVAPAPRTWAAGDFPTAGRLRADPVNLAWLLTQRPMFAGAQLISAQPIGTSSVTGVEIDTEYLDNWYGHTVASSLYVPQLAGWYLADGTALYSSTAVAAYGAGIEPTQNGTPAVLFVFTCGNGVNAPGPQCSDLVQLNPATSDTVRLVGWQTTGVSQNMLTPGAYLSVGWAGLPTSVGGVTGTVVTSPQPAALWPPGAGTTISNGGGIAAGATSITVASAAGIVTGATLGLDFYEGAAVQPWAEQVTVTSVAGTTLGITATAYAHAQGAPVAVPVSAAFMNQQVKDTINFLAYPPMCRLSNFGSAQTIPSQTFPAGTAISFASATCDNFSGWNGTSEYVAPVSGVYYVYGQVATASSTGTFSAGIGVSGGTIAWGDSVRTQTAQITVATVRKHLRLTAGQYLQLFGSQSSGAARAVSLASNCYCTLIALWRGF